MQETFKHWGESMEILDRIEQTADETQAVATAAMEKLKLQEEQFRAIDEGLDNVQSNVKRARSEIASFARGVARQKCIFIIIAGIVLAILFIVIAVIVWQTCLKLGKCQISGVSLSIPGTNTTLSL